MPALKRRRRSGQIDTVKYARTRQGRRSSATGLAGTRTPWLQGLLSFCNSWLSLVSLLDLPQRWTTLLGGVRGRRGINNGTERAAEVVHLPDWAHMEDIAYEIFGYLDSASMAHVAATTHQLRSNLRSYARNVARRAYGDIPIGFASHALSVGVADESPSFGAMALMESLGPRLIRQRIFQPRPDSLETVQSERVASGQFITRHMRTVLVDWMIEVAAEYRLSPVCLHASVNLMDRCLGIFTIPRHRLQLLGCCCLLMESQRYSGYQMTIDDVCYISDSQYDEFQVVAMFNLVTGNTQEPEEERSAETVQGFLRTFLTHMELRNLTGAEAPPVGCISEEVVLANLLADLSLLDYHMLRFHPSTIATSVLFLTRMTMQHFSEQRLTITSMGLLATPCREVLGLCNYHRPYIERKPAYGEEPWGFPALRLLVQSYDDEALACAFCISQLWRLHCDFMFHTSGIGDEPHVLGAHHYMLKGITDRYCPADSDRATAWKTLGTVPEAMVHEWVRKHLKISLSAMGRFPRT